MKHIIDSDRDRFKWKKQKEYINNHDSIDENTKSKAIDAFSFLELEFGARFLKTTTINHPVRYMISNKTPYQIKDLIDFTNTLKTLKEEDNNYKRLVGKLSSQEDAKTEGIPMMNVARMFTKEDFIITFLDEIKSKKRPDIKIDNPNNNDTFYVEITKLNDSDYQNQIRDNYILFHNQFNNNHPIIPFYGKQFETIEKCHYQEVKELITDAKKRALETSQIIYHDDYRFKFLVAPPSLEKELNEFFLLSNLNINDFQGLSVDIDETSRINNKICKANQIPENENGLLFISISPLYFLITNISEVIKRLETNIGKYKNLLGIILFSEIVADKESKIKWYEKNCFSRKTIENLCKESLFIYNENCDIKLTEETIQKIYKVLA